GGAAVSTQTAAASGAAVGTQTERDELRPRNEGESVAGDGGSGGIDDDVGGVTADAAAAERVEARGEGDAPVESVEERAAGQEDGVARSVSALEAENARLADELAKARSRLEELATAAVGAPAEAPARKSAPSAAERALEPGQSPGTTAGAAASTGAAGGGGAGGAGGGDDAVVVPGAVEGEDPAPMPIAVGVEFARPRRSYSDVVVSGSGRRESAHAAAAAAAAAGGG
ncbi:unnamed protein product, partial [Ectocarpus sp. 12 AP-2014]